MKISKLAAFAGILLFGLTSTAFATGYNYSGYNNNNHGSSNKHGSNNHGSSNKCGGGGTSTSCNDAQDYTSELYVDSFTKSTSGYNKNYWTFEGIDLDVYTGLEITSATLTVNTSGNGINDYLWFKSNNNWYKGPSLTGGEQTFGINSNLFDEIIKGWTFKAWFGLDTEEIFSAQLNVTGKYCPPVSEVPVPAAVWLFGSALVGFTGFRRRLKQA